MPLLLKKFDTIEINTGITSTLRVSLTADSQIKSSQISDRIILGVDTIIIESYIFLYFNSV